MNASPSAARRARPLLGTLVEVGVLGIDGSLAFEAAFGAVARVQACMSRFEPASDIGRFNALAAGEAIEVDAWTAEVLQAARSLQAGTQGLFDVALGSACDGWRLEGQRLHKRTAGTQLDLGGIAKGFAVDRAVDALRAQNANGGWVNAGGDLRVFGTAELPVNLRDEARGGVRPFGQLANGALATSHFDARSRSGAWHARRTVEAHVTVIAPQCLWADALTKVVALEGRCDHPLLRAHGAQAWLH